MIAYGSQIRETVFSGEFCEPPNNSRSAQVGFLRKLIFQPPTEQKKVAQVGFIPPRIIQVCQQQHQVTLAIPGRVSTGNLTNYKWSKKESFFPFRPDDPSLHLKILDSWEILAKIILPEQLPSLGSLFISMALRHPSSAQRHQVARVHKEGGGCLTTTCSLSQDVLFIPMDSY